MSEEKNFINWSQITTTIIVTAVITSVGTAITLLRLSDSQAIYVSSNAKAIEKLEIGSVSRAEFEQVVLRFDKQYENMDKKLDQLLKNTN